MSVIISVRSVCYYQSLMYVLLSVCDMCVIIIECYALIHFVMCAIISLWCVLSPVCDLCAIISL